MPVVELQRPKGCIIKDVNAYMHSYECVDIKAPVPLCRIFFRLFMIEGIMGVREQSETGRYGNRFCRKEIGIIHILY